MGCPALPPLLLEAAGDALIGPTWKESCSSSQGACALSCLVPQGCLDLLTRDEREMTLGPWPAPCRLSKQKKLSLSCLCYANGPDTPGNHLNMRLGMKSASEEVPVTVIRLHVSVGKRAVQAGSSNPASSPGSWIVPDGKRGRKYLELETKANGGKCWGTHCL